MSDPMQGILAEAKSNKYSLIKDKLSEDGKSLYKLWYYSVFVKSEGQMITISCMIYMKESCNM